MNAESKDESGKNWGYVLDGAGRPERELQRRVMALAHVDISEFGTLWADRLTPQPTRPRQVMRQREYLAMAVQEGDRVHVADLLCLGVSVEDVRWFVGELHEAGATLVVHDEARIVDPGSDLTEMLAAFDRARNALYVRRSYRKSRAKTKKGKRDAARD